MDHSPADIIRYALVDLGAGTLPSLQQEWPIFVHLEPDTPDNCMVVYDTVGFLQGRLHPTGQFVNHYGFQVLLRTSNAKEGMIKLASVEALLNSVRRLEVSVEDAIYLVHSTTQRTPILPLGRDVDNSDRSLFTINYTVTLEPVDTGTGTGT